jgi:putative lipoic acid-binding regulatory protein
MNKTPAAQESLIEYPCTFPIKVMGLQSEGFTQAMTEIVQRFDPGWQSGGLEERSSSNGKYLGLTFHVYVNNREELDGLYLAFTSHPMVKVVL